MPCASVAVSASGFSHSTCLPARAAAMVHGGVQVVRERDVDGVDVGVGQHRLVRPVRPLDAQPRRHARRAARLAGRDPEHLAARRSTQARDHLLGRDVGGGQHAPADAIARSRPHPRTSPRAASEHPRSDLTRTRVCWSLAHVCKRGSQTLRVGRVDVGQRSETVHRSNLSAIVRRLHEQGPQSRSELVAATGLTRSAIRALVGELAAAGLVTERDAVRLGTPGRPSPIVRLNATGAVVLSLEILVDSIAAAIVGLGGETLEHVRLDRPRRELLRRRRGRRPGGAGRGPARTRRLADRRHRRRGRGHRAADGRPGVDGPQPRLDRRPPRGPPRPRAVGGGADQRAERRGRGRPGRAPPRGGGRRRQRAVRVGRGRRRRRPDRRRPAAHRRRRASPARSATSP